jgi:hypothetical protein
MQFASLQLTGPPDQLETWLGPHQLPIEIDPGSPSTKAVVLTSGSGAAVILERIPF